MDIRLSDLDWTLISAFLAVAETGSLSAAAKQLGASQPTLGRQIRALETTLRAELFTRQPRGLKLTATGEVLLEPARRMRDAASEIALTAAGRADQLDGTVRITASEFMAQYFLPALIADLRRAEPRIQIELVPNNGTDNLLFGEADVAVRMFQPDQLETIAKRLGDVELGAFASVDYMAERPMPQTLTEALKLDFVGQDQDTRIIRGMRGAGLSVDRSFFATRCDMSSVYWELVRAGCGAGFGPVPIATGDPKLIRLLTDVHMDLLPVWIVAHERMRQVPRIRRVWEHLCTHVPPLLS